MSTIDDQDAEPFDHIELIEQSARSQLGRALADLRAAICGFTESRQRFYEGLLFQLEVGLGVSREQLELRIRQATMLELVAAPEGAVQTFLKIAATGRIAQEDVIRLQEQLGVPREQWRFLCTKHHRACSRSTRTENDHDHDD